MQTPLFPMLLKPRAPDKVAILHCSAVQQLFLGWRIPAPPQPLQAQARLCAGCWQKQLGEFACYCGDSALKITRKDGELLEYALNLDAPLAMTASQGQAKIAEDKLHIEGMQA